MLYHLDAGDYTARLEEGTKVFFIAAAPIGEKVESYGPFAMTNRQKSWKLCEITKWEKWGIW